jgi:hypothetical protein
VHKLSKAWPLLRRGLVVNAIYSDSGATGELHPTLLAKRQELVRILSRALQN